MLLFYFVLCPAVSTFPACLCVHLASPAISVHLYPPFPFFFSFFFKLRLLSNWKSAVDSD